VALPLCLRGWSWSSKRQSSIRQQYKMQKLRLYGQ